MITSLHTLNALHHRRLITYDKKYVTKAEILVSTFGTTDKKFPKIIGKVFKPFGTHNYAYGTSVIEMVTMMLDNMGEAKESFVRYYDSDLLNTWQDEKLHGAFDTMFKARMVWVPHSNEALRMIGSKELQNEGEMIVLCAEYRVLDIQEQMILANKSHLLGWAMSLATLLYIYGLKNGLKLSLWLFVIGIIETEAFSYTSPVVGSSVIGYGFLGAILFGYLFRMKKWEWYNYLGFLWNVISTAAPFIKDPPLASRYFLAGKMVSHVGHMIGLFYGVLTPYFVA